MRETESGFVVGDGDDAAEFMNFELGHDSGGEGGDEDGQKGSKKGNKKRGALNAQPKRKKDELPEVVPSHRISQMFLNSKSSKRKTERVEDDAEEEDLNAMLDSILNDPTAMDSVMGGSAKSKAATAPMTAAPGKDRKRAVSGRARCGDGLLCARSWISDLAVLPGDYQHKDAVQGALGSGRLFPAATATDSRQD